MSRKITVDIVGDSSGLERSFGRAKTSATGLNSAVGSLRIGIGSLVKSFIVIEALDKAFEGLKAAVGSGISEFKESTQIQAQTATALKSTGSIAGETAKQIHGLALELSNLSGQSDESIQAAENVLLAFTNIRNSAGKGNDIFTQATKAVVDFAARTGRDAPQAALVLGKALQDPAQRLASLSRAGIVFTKSQVEAFKALEKNKGILAAQKALLVELTKRYGGAADAAGKTLPGALNVLKERFRDLAGEGVAKVAPALTTAAVGLAGFVREITEAQGATAKFHVATDALRGLADNLAKSIRAAVSRIDWDAVFRGAKGIGTALIHLWALELSGVRDLGSRLAAVVKTQVEAVNWPQVISKAGHAVGTALIASLNALTGAVKKVNWNKVGKAIADGLAIAVAATVKFLASVNWTAVAKATITFLVAAFKATNALFTSLGRELGKFVLEGLQTGLSAAGRTLERLALDIALKIVEPFTHLPKLLGGGKFQEIEDDLKQTLDDMGRTGAAGGQAVGAAVVQGMSDGVKSAFGDFSGAVNAAVASVLKNSNAETATNLISDAASSGQPTVPLQPVAADLLGGPAKKPKGITADQRNTFFDNRISRLLDRVQDAPIKQQIAKLKAISGLVSQRLAATKDVTRRLTLEDKLVDIGRTIKSTQATVVQNANDFFDSAISLALDRLQYQSLTKQVVSLKVVSGLIQKRIDATKDVKRKQTLEDQLLSVNEQSKQDRQQIADNFIASLQLNYEKAQLTSGIGDDVKALKTLEKALQARVVEEAKAAKLAAITPNQPTKKLFELPGSNTGLLKPGNLDLLHRKIAKIGKDIATVRSFSVSTDNGELLLPSVINGKVVSFKKAIKHAFSTGENLGLFDNAKDADVYAERLHLQQAKFYIVGKTSGKAVASGITDGLTTDTELRLAQVKKDIAQALNDARNATQFKALGLTAAGNAVTPGVKALKSDLASVNDAISGSFLDTSKTKGILAHVKQVLSGGLGVVGQQVRAQVKSILDDLDNQLKNHSGDVTKFRHISSSKFVASLGLNLTAAQTRSLRSKVAQIGAGGTIANPQPAFALAGGGSTFVLNNPHFHGVTDVGALETQLTKRAKSRPQQRRGPYAGRH